MIEQSVEPPACPDENALSELVQGLLPVPLAAAIELHLDGCDECRRIVSAVGQSSFVARRRTHIESDRAVGSGLTAPVADASDMPVPEAGTVLAGKYRVEGLLGQGGMGVVVAATHLQLGKLVALKLMRPDLAVDPGAAQRFVREARAASALRSEHIVRVLDLDTLEDGVPYMAMEYLEGEDLGAMLARRGAIPAREAVTYVVQVCDAIAEAHAAGIVHRDLKPANLFVTHRAGTPCVKVLDFGVSKIIAGGPLQGDIASTDTRALVGSPHYMAPEQLISAKAVDPRTDVWALGCILYELVSARRPFGANDVLAQVLASILRDVPDPLDVAGLPAGFADVVARCLDKDPARRYQRVEELAVALGAFSEAIAPAHVTRATSIGFGTPAPRIGTMRQDVPLRPPARVARGTTAPTRRPRRRAPMIAVAVAVLGLGAIAGYVATRHRADEVGASAPAASTIPSAPSTTPPASASTTPTSARPETPASTSTTTRPSNTPAPAPTKPAAPRTTTTRPAATPPVSTPPTKPAATTPTTTPPTKPASPPAPPAKKRLEDDLLPPKI